MVLQTPIGGYSLLTGACVDGHVCIYVLPLSRFMSELISRKYFAFGCLIRRVMYNLRNDVSYNMKLPASPLLSCGPIPLCRADADDGLMMFMG